ncbi:Bifunctional polynucleotide phosphatase/kinase, partial [Fasciolopsis buskii]
RQCTLTKGADLENNDSNSHSYWKVSSSLLVYTPPDVKPSSNILALDLDNTIITTVSGKTFPKDCNDWKLLNDKVSAKLKEYHQDGYKIVIMSNQHGIEKGHITVPAFQNKIENIVDKIHVPIQVFVSILPDRNRKPLTGMWEQLENNENGNVKVDKSSSIFCGDAAGRPAQGKQKKDFSCSDLLFSMNVGVKFLTPEQLWLNENYTGTFCLPEFNAKRLLENPDPVLPSLIKPSKPEMIILVGFPASGKSHFCRQRLAPLGYTIVSRDTIGTWQKCVQACKAAIAKGQSVVVDNTNMDAESRSRYIDVAKQANCPVRCFIMDTSVAHARHNERFRMVTDSSHTKVSQMVFNTLKAKYQEPETKEGFSEIIKIPFVLDRSLKEIDLYCMHLLEK